MNNETNYPYLAGYLRGALQRLADDGHFLKLETNDERRAYINSIIADADVGSKEYASFAKK